MPPDIETFRHWELGEPIQACIEGMGITSPTPIQRLAIQHVLDGKDVIAKAETGTGKTLAFGAPMLARIDPARATVLGLVLCPTRELAEQVQKVLAILGAARGVKTALIVGGEPMEPQVKALKAGAQVVVGTPGRVLDLYKQRFLSFPWTEFAVLDEADVMLEIGFIDDVKQILSYTPDERQTLLFSATFPPELLKLAREYTRNPAEVATAAGLKTVDTITQSWMQVEPDDYALALVRLIEQSAAEDVFLVFCPRRTDVDRLMRRLERFPFAIKALHGGYDQEARFRVMSAFRTREVKALIATDVASRGLDVAHVTHVVNLGSPQDITDYTHRIGRTGRAGRKGAAITIVSSGRDMLKWKRALHEATWDIPQVDPPGATRRGSDRERNAARQPRPAPVVVAPPAAPTEHSRYAPRRETAPVRRDEPRRDEPRAREARESDRNERAPRTDRPRRDAERGRPSGGGGERRDPAWPEDRSTERSAALDPHEWTPEASHMGGSARGGEAQRKQVARPTEARATEPRAENARDSGIARDARPPQSRGPARDEERREGRRGDAPETAREPDERRPRGEERSRRDARGAQDRGARREPRDGEREPRREPEAAARGPIARPAHSAGDERESRREPRAPAAERGATQEPRREAPPRDDAARRTPRAAPAHAREPRAPMHERESRAPVPERETRELAGGRETRELAGGRETREPAGGREPRERAVAPDRAREARAPREGSRGPRAETRAPIDAERAPRRPTRRAPRASVVRHRKRDARIRNAPSRRGASARPPRRRDRLRGPRRPRRHRSAASVRPIRAAARRAKADLARERPRRRDSRLPRGNPPPNRPSRSRAIPTRDRASAGRVNELRRGASRRRMGRARASAKGCRLGRASSIAQRDDSSSDPPWAAPIPISARSKRGCRHRSTSSRSCPRAA